MEEVAFLLVLSSLVWGGGGVQIRLLHSLRKKVPQFVSVLASPPSQYALRFRQPDGSLHSTHRCQDGVK